MNDDAIPEFISLRRQADVLAEALDVVRELKERVDRLMPAISHHPSCTECCAMNRCHWCLMRPESGTLTSTGPDGYVYSACRAHVQYFAEMQRRANPSAGLDLRAGLQQLNIAAPSPLMR